ncbi:26S proteasome non-ATPase regulatory subunit 2 homolog A-like [Ipomoea triloba]|uniref:26S proteasome non-ATPase regulatory subunit 2 homolog A-like n=1 Tax=Ipomoea triloba TaxID=35885 RepID=UPI00125D42CD|nr:26S proteasome non-ATPase regulatory subunit 2 homolog A-like [Ipomoea triloba]
MTLDPNDAGDKMPAREEASVKVPAKYHKKKDKKDEYLSEEDFELKQQLELYVEHVQDADLSLQTRALESIRQEIQTATRSMASVPKPVKFLRPHYGTLKSHYEKMSDSDAKELMADILSVLAMTMSAEGERESLKYRLLGSYGDIGPWGHEYVRNLAVELAQEYLQIEVDTPINDLMYLKRQIVAFHMKHNAEPEAVDLLIEGMIMLWDVEIGLAQIDKYFHSTDTHVVAGALLAVGIVNCNVKNKRDPALAILTEYVVKEEPCIRVGAIIGLGLAYAGSQRYQVFEQLRPILEEDTNASLDVIAFTVITLGLVFVGSCKEDIARAIRFSLKNRSESELGEPLARLLPLGLGLLYLGKQDIVGDVAAEVSRTFSEKIKRHCDMTLLSCAYAGTGNINRFRDFAGECAEDLEKGETYPGPAVLGIAMVEMTKELEVERALRALKHFPEYGQRNIRRAVPLAMGLLRISNPKVNVTNTLSRLIHDSDTEVAMAAIISLGLIGAGTNNARIVGMLHDLSSYYYKESDLLFCVRIAQGLVNLGKGLLTLSPYHSERFLFSQTALAGLLVTLHACLDMKALILGEYHYLLYFLSLAMMPRMLMTVDENLKPLSVPVRVGQAVHVAYQPGRPKAIIGFRTYSTPVLLSAGDKAELATDKYIPLSPFLEGFVILKENPEYKDDH